MSVLLSNLADGLRPSFTTDFVFRRESAIFSGPAPTTVPTPHARDGEQDIPEPRTFSYSGGTRLGVTP